MDKLRIGQKLSLAMLLLIISNIVTGINNSETIGNYLTKVVLLILLTAPLFLVKKELPKSILSWILLILCIPTVMFGDISNLNGFFLFLFSLSLSVKSKKIYTIFLSLFISALLYKFNLLSSAPSQIMEYSAGIIFIGFIYQHYIHPTKNKNPIDYSKKVIEKLQIDNTVCLIMIDYVKGYTWDDISKNLKLNVTGDRVQRIVKKEMTEKGYHNYADLCCYLTDVGIIKAIDKNLITE